jgi:hypothetical protein
MIQKFFSLLIVVLVQSPSLLESRRIAGLLCALEVEARL